MMKKYYNGYRFGVNSRPLYNSMLDKIQFAGKLEYDMSMLS